MNSIERLLKKEEELKEIRKKGERVWDEFREIAQEITPDQLTELGYEKAKEVCKIIFHLVSEERYEELSVALRKLELAEYPESEGAVWYPDINKIPGLSLKEKYILDEAFIRFRIGEFINLSCPLMQKTGLVKERLKESAEFLTQKGVLKKYYRLGCQNCGEEDIFDEETIQEIFSEEKTPYCMECDKEMFRDKDELRADLENGPDVVYRVEKQPEDVKWRK